ncbi:lipid A core-O-antigen ligase-like enyme [Mesorhizobium australicum WSM2073]|uniref:Lipid A core-O-antigen ligase-like enyme n=1 Tax=Mesorhizobium australicum (strain HAMBI 3006 / LMG 24608 / WSM2073) TaxID=754035 RepID=L0KRN9_MESAW|nr:MULTISPECIES: O-antigen ligase family protein [Mesorhizobium]AGB47325.1 lipid A core-O-antigen ligase-like enyme [Mesorhizobium australicum WSM2073]MBZ9727416.1 O-antigen ligase family protein [Mesorhizobium sp. CO1-1-11]
MSLFQKCHAVILGGFPAWTSNRDEIVFRMLLGLYALSPALFAFVEMSPTVLTLVGALMGALALLTKRARFARGTIGLAIALALLSGFVLASALWSVDASRSLMAARDVFGYSIAAILLFQGILALASAQRERLARVSLAGMLIGVVSVMGWELYFAFLTEDPRFVENVFTLHKITVYGAFFAVIFLAQPRLVWKGLAALFAVLTLLYGRSTGVNLAIVLVAVMFVMPAKYRQHVLVGFFAVYLSLALIAPFVVAPLFAYLKTTGWLAFYPGTFAARLDLWQMISPRIADQPILGHGANTIRNAAGVVVSPTYYAQADLPSAHNIVFDLWYELGALGIIVYGVLLAAIIRMIGGLSGPCHFIASSYLIIAVVELSVDHRIWLSWVLGILVFAAGICIVQCRSMTRSGMEDGTTRHAAAFSK